ncbi:MAG TPA: hypothetical protein VFE98_00990 [Candidatus Bathyarchaeia archaeon]|nr:hypothetical protein [Candidatus Bathyarchaeia archaeon]
MSQDLAEEQALLEKNLREALEEAYTKTNIAISELTNRGEDFVKKVWAASEAVEYSSLLFSLTYDLQDYDPEVERRRGVDPISLVKDSLQPLKLAMETRKQSRKKAYESLRIAAYYLRTAYLDLSKKTTRRRDDARPAEGQVSDSRTKRLHSKP